MAKKSQIHSEQYNFSDLSAISCKTIQLNIYFFARKCSHLQIWREVVGYIWKQLATQREEFEAKKLQTVNDLEAAKRTIQTLEVEIGNRDMMLQSMVDYISASPTVHFWILQWKNG